MTQKFWSVRRSLRALTICTDSSLKFSVKRYGLVFRLVKKERDWVVPFTKCRCPLFLERKHGTLSTGNSRKGIVNFDRFLDRFGKSGKSQYLRRCTFHLKNFQRDETFNLNSHRNFRVFYTNGKRSKSLLITAYGQLSAHAHYRQCSAYAHAQFGHCLWGNKKDGRDGDRLCISPLNYKPKQA